MFYDSPSRRCCNIDEQLLKPELPAGITGNSRMLACLGQNGELYRLFWPDIDYGQHLGIFWTGLHIKSPRRDNRTLWFHTMNRVPGQCYLDDTNIIETRYSCEQQGLHVVQTDFVLPDRDVLVRRCTVRNGGKKIKRFFFFLYCAPVLEESNLYDGAFFDSVNQSLVFFRRHVYLTLGAGGGHPLAGYQCGRRGAPSDPLNEACRGRLWGLPDNMLMSSGSLAWDMGELKPEEESEFAVYMVAGGDRDSNREELAALRSKTAGEWQLLTAMHWQGVLNRAKPVPGDERERAAYKRSILAMQLMSSKKTGASIAAPEFDPQYRMSGGYGYCWGRDSTYVAVALDEAGFVPEAEKFYTFAARVQNRDGSWFQRYFTDGSAAPTWGKQIDQAATILWGYSHHYRVTRNRHFLAEIWPSLEAGASYLERSLEKNGLPAAGMDIWEDANAQSTYAAAAVCGGLMAAAGLAAVAGDIKKEEQWRSAAEKVRAGIIEHLWSGEKNRFIRGINLKVSRDDYRQARQRGETACRETDSTGLYPAFRVPFDRRLDAALLGLAFPFGVLKPDDPKMLSTARAIEDELWNSDTGGVHRYTGDSYRGGNPWLITTFWLSIYHSLLGNRERAKELCRWGLDQANHLLLLPEQADRSKGGPAWVMPLNWSHAMYILAVRALNGNYPHER